MNVCKILRLHQTSSVDTINYVNSQAQRLKTQKVYCKFFQNNPSLNITCQAYRLFPVSFRPLSFSYFSGRIYACLLLLCILNAAEHKYKKARSEEVGQKGIFYHRKFIIFHKGCVFNKHIQGLIMSIKFFCCFQLLN